jgi:hypothetical protein
MNRPRRDHGDWRGGGAVWLTALLITLLVTGAVMHGHEPMAMVEADDLDAPRWHHVATVVHGAFAWVFCLVIGRWAWPHVARVWPRQNRNRIWALGFVTALTGGVAALTGLGLLYGNADWRELLVAIHWWVGLAWPIACLAHAWKWIAGALRRVA